MLVLMRRHTFCFRYLQALAAAFSDCIQAAEQWWSCLVLLNTFPLVVADQ